MTATTTTTTDRSAVELLCEATGRKACPRCRCCEMYWELCERCGGDGHTEPGELYEDDPLWYDYSDTEPCPDCYGACGWWRCNGGCDNGGKHDT